jgi:hypothetical protein
MAAKTSTLLSTSPASGSKKQHYQAFGAFLKPGIHVSEPHQTKVLRVSLVELPQWRKKTCLES